MRRILARQPGIELLSLDPIEFEHAYTNTARILGLAGIGTALVEVLNVPTYKCAALIDALYFAAEVGERTKDGESQTGEGRSSTVSNEM